MKEETASCRAFFQDLRRSVPYLGRPRRDRTVAPLGLGFPPRPRSGPGNRQILHATDFVLHATGETAAGIQGLKVGMVIA
jgi:hypothetical protein